MRGLEDGGKREEGRGGIRYSMRNRKRFGVIGIYYKR